MLTQKHAPTILGRIKRDPKFAKALYAEAVNALAHEAGLTPVADYAMPANNRLLVWQKQE